MDYSFLAISDCHIGWKLFNLPELAQDLKDDLVRVFDLALQLKVNYVFVAGDLYDTNKPSPDLVKFVSDQVKRLEANGCIVAGIAGDHDKPVNGSAWIHLSSMLQINDVPEVGTFVGYDYTDNSQENVEKLANHPRKDKIEWIFLHGHAPELFQWCEDKKKLDFKEVDLINDFPALKGIVLGDIHKPIEGVISDPKMLRKPEPFIGYCGSLGMVKTDEINTKTGILYFDGKEVKRVPFKADREFIRIHIADLIKPINLIPKLYRFFRKKEGKKPVILIEYDKDTKPLLAEASILYDVAIVKISQVRKSGKEDKEKGETVNIRSDLKTNDKISQTLKELTSEQDVYDLVFSLITAEDPKAILDKFKKKTLH